jgi:hypothetical protein
MVWGLEFKVMGFKVWGFRVWGLKIGVRGLEFG